MQTGLSTDLQLSMKAERHCVMHKQVMTYL